MWLHHVDAILRRQRFPCLLKPGNTLIDMFDSPCTDEACNHPPVAIPAEKMH
ncbi:MULTISPECIES: hypothetical protein [unclassified Serratia (in: enterobacteria)]|uniref:hypothetical protein n=1 Tax=unclassified Serratia (in: enterobacteria) TaxID=2647522 RepID=UPI002ED14DD1|nr:hypothetical protein [Serratia sp. C2(2)]MEE4448627.1 hypothetical protein [Serratia sp. C2(1)]